MSKENNNLAPQSECSYFSARNLQLLYVGKPVSVPVITLENYTKWYSVHVVMPDGSVKVASVSDIPTEMLPPFAIWSDHCIHPYALELLAKIHGGEVDERAQEVAIGRWILETGLYDELITKEHFNDIGDL